MNSILNIVFAFLGLFLPLHGGITVFLPDTFRYWKEILLLLLIAIVIKTEIRTFLLLKNKKFTQKLIHWSASLKIPEEICLGISFLALLLTFFSEDKQTSIEAVRYLVLPFFVFFTASRISKNHSQKDKEISFRDYFSHFFILGCVVSVGFGTWVQSGFGIDFVQNFYSNIISSWVPGQTLQIWHETNGLMRMQGLSSGPIEFSHLLLVGLVLIPQLYFKKITKHLLYFIFFLGIFFSYSRAAMAGGIILIIWNTFNHLLIDMNRKKIGIFLGIFLIASISSIFLFKNNIFIQKIISRTSTSDHFTRPIEAFKIGMQSPLSGNLGKLGPAARAKNMRENNSDKALIAENIFIDYFAQLGIIGFGLFLWFWISICRQASRKFLGFFWVSMFVFCLATVFDMTPISISYMILFAFFPYFSRTK